MLVGETIRVALTALRTNTLRSLLTMLGIVIGVAAVIAMVAFGNGAEGVVKDRIARLGTTVLQINPQRRQRMRVDAHSRLQFFGLTCTFPSEQEGCDRCSTETADWFAGRSTSSFSKA